MSKINVEVLVGMPKSKLGKATLNILIDPKVAEQTIGASQDVTNATLEKYVRDLLVECMTLTVVNGRDASKVVREARRRAKAE